MSAVTRPRRSRPATTTPAAAPWEIALSRHAQALAAVPAYQAWVAECRELGAAATGTRARLAYDGWAQAAIDAAYQAATRYRHPTLLADVVTSAHRPERWTQQDTENYGTASCWTNAAARAVKWEAARRGLVRAPSWSARAWHEIDPGHAAQAQRCDWAAWHAQACQRCMGRTDQQMVACDEAAAWAEHAALAGVAV